MNIRKANSKDIPILISLCYKLFLRFEKLDKVDKLDKHYWKSEKQKADFRKLLKKQDYLFLVAEENNKIIGYIKCSIFQNYPIFQIKKKGHIETLYILPEYQKKGFGKKLVEKALKWFKSKQIKHYTVGTHALDNTANSFWKKRKFIEYNYKLKR